MQEIRITANGLEHEVPFGITVERLLDIMNEPVRPDMIVEINRRFIHIKEYRITVIKEGDSVEVIGLDIGG